jgi:hypothetical protein
MALAATFRTLTVQIRKLCDTLSAVLLTVGDKPTDRGAALADGLENTLLDMLGLAEDARRAARAADKAVSSRMDVDRARQALSRCQESFHRMEQQFLNRLVSYEKLKDLACLGRERGGEWKPWAASMKDAIEQARQPIEESSKAIAACWQELAERIVTTSVSVSTTNIGQQITSAAAKTRDLNREGVS